jgi:hypothetical protein
VESSVGGVEDYMAGLPVERRDTVRSMLDFVRAAMPSGYGERVGHGMIGWGVPLERYPTTYNGEPLAYVALASQQRHYSLYLVGLYMQAEAAEDFRRRWSGARPLDMGKSCVRFRAVEDLDLPLIAAAIAAVPVDDLIATYERARQLAAVPPRGAPASDGRR